MGDHKLVVFFFSSLFSFENPNPAETSAVLSQRERAAFQTHSCKHIAVNKTLNFWEEGKIQTIWKRRECPPKTTKPTSREPDGSMDARLKTAKVIYVGDSFQDSDLHLQREDKKKSVVCSVSSLCLAVAVSAFHIHIHQHPHPSPNDRCIIAVRSWQRRLFVIVCCLHIAAIQMCYLVRINDPAMRRRKRNINNFLHKWYFHYCGRL